jgi:hypothetical protein
MAMPERHGVRELVLRATGHHLGGHELLHREVRGAPLGERADREIAIRDHPQRAPVSRADRQEAEVPVSHATRDLDHELVRVSRLDR